MYMYLKETSILCILLGYGNHPMTLRIWKILTIGLKNYWSLFHFDGAIWNLSKMLISVENKTQGLGP